MPEVDLRSSHMRRLRDLTAQQLADLGGAERTSEAERLLVRRSAQLTLQLELMEMRFAEAEDGAASPQQLEVYQRATNSLRRVLTTLGLERRARPITGRLDATREIVEAITERSNAGR